MFDMCLSDSTRNMRIHVGGRDPGGRKAVVLEKKKVMMITIVKGLSLRAIRCTHATRDPSSSFPPLFFLGFLV